MYDIKSFYITLKKTENEIEKINLLNKTGWEIKASYPKDALKMAMEARELSQKNLNKEGIACSYRNSGAAYYLLSQYSSALADLQQALLLYRELENIDAEATIIRNIGNVYHSMEQNEKSLECYFKALQITEQQKDLQGTAYNHGNIGYVYQKIGQYDLALEHMLKTQSLVEELNDSLGLADVLNNIGKVYFSQKKYKEAFPYFQQSLEKAISIDHLRGIANAHCSLGNFYKTKKDFAKAIEHQSKALQAAQKMGEQLIILDINKNFSIIYEEMGDYQTSLSYFKIYEGIKNEILNRKNELSITAMQSQYELERLEKEKEIYKLKNIELAKAKEEIEKVNVLLERLSIVASETENVVLILTPEGIVEWANESFTRLNGITIDELKRRKGETIFEISNNPSIRESFEIAIKEKKSVVYESLNLNKEGERIWESSTLTPIFNSDGTLKKLVIIDTDVSKRKEVEELLQQKNKDITDSINYAQKIQQAILPDQHEFTKLFPDSFVFFKPKDIVSGDFYWLAQKNGYVFYAAVDCTGHGVPGGFMSMLGSSLLNEIINDKNVFEPGDILDLLRIKIIQALKQKGESGENKDGMDMCLCRINKDQTELVYAAANNPLWIVRNNELLEFASNKQPVGISGGEFSQFEQHSISLKSGDSVYIFTDGFADQFGGSKGKKFKYKPLKELLLSNNQLPMSSQKEILDITITDWKGDLEQVDDILIIGLKIH